MKKSCWKIHCVMKCQDCGVEFENHKNGQALAAKHAKSKKHFVTGEIALAVQYDGR